MGCSPGGRERVERDLVMKQTHKLERIVNMEVSIWEVLLAVVRKLLYIIRGHSIL